MKDSKERFVVTADTALPYVKSLFLTGLMVIVSFVLVILRFGFKLRKLDIEKLIFISSWVEIASVIYSSLLLIFQDDLLDFKFFRKK